MKVRIAIELTDLQGWLKNIISKYHFENQDYDLLSDIYEQMCVHSSPYAMYRINHRMTGISMIDDSQVAMVALTLGSGIDTMKERFARQGQLSEGYMLDCLANELLLVLYKEFNKNYAKFHRRYVQRYVFIGDEISPAAIPQILSDIKGIKPDKSEHSVTEDSQPEFKEILREQEDIRANEYGVLTPSKSVVFYAILSDNPNQICEGICTGCGNVLCDNRVEEYRQLAGLMLEENNKKSPQGAMNYGYMRIFGA